MTKDNKMPRPPTILLAAAVKLSSIDPPSPPLTSAAAARVTLQSRVRVARDKTAQVAAAAALLLSVTRAAHQTHKLAGDISAGELEVEVALIADYEMDSLRTSEAAGESGRGGAKRLVNVSKRSRRNRRGSTAPPS